MPSHRLPPGLSMLNRAAPALIVVLFASPAVAQTPSALAYWQYSVGEVLEGSQDKAPPEWAITLGGGALIQPNFEGAKHYEGEPSVIIDIRYRDIAFASDGEGVGVNLLHGRNYRAGVALAYDLGRDQHDDPHLRGLGNIDAAPEAKVFAEYFLLPVVFSAALHQAIGGHNGLLGEFGAYIPLPLFDQKLIIFTGPTLTLADGEYMRSYFGVSAKQAAATSFRQYNARGGFKSTGWGVTAVYRLDERWLIESDFAYERLLGDAANSPIVETSSQFTAGLNLAYRF
jgi:outer membrane scaffolding protein for murein synthesis (MipA/OmpV family)